MAANTQFPKATYRYDPYKTYKFRVKWDGKYVAGVSKVGALTRTTEVVRHRSGGDPSTPRRSPGQSSYEAITLERAAELLAERRAKGPAKKAAQRGAKKTAKKATKKTAKKTTKKAAAKK